jgi:ectoine hydroxylase-related dioxygenase (phytanoyl-CoA dioxygenase family)
MNLTIISHIFNEEYLLPFWLEYHKKIFDNGIIIDYFSTDKSVEIIKKICPNWKVIKTKNLNSQGGPNFQADLIDVEVMEVEKTILNSYKICLNTTEFLMVRSKDSLLKLLKPDYIYGIKELHAFNVNKDIYPKNLYDLIDNITHYLYDITYKDRIVRFLHSSNFLHYHVGRHDVITKSRRIIDLETKDIFIFWLGFYPYNQEFIKRKLQIKNNIPKSDFESKAGFQHFWTENQIDEVFEERFNKSLEICKNDNILDLLNNIKINIKNSLEIFYPELVSESEWGQDEIIINKDINLISDTEMDKLGYGLFEFPNEFNKNLVEFITHRISKVINKQFDNLEKYHEQVSNEEHKLILNDMPYKKQDPLLDKLSHYLENFVSQKINKKVRIFNDDIWVRICRPTIKYGQDFNPCHKDIYLDFYKNVINIYYPIIGSNASSSLFIQPESHKWNEKDIMRTKGGAYLKRNKMKFSVDAIVASKNAIHMIRPNPNENEIMIFTPYLIHGCTSNENDNMTRMSLEVRFILDNEESKKQEDDLREYLKIRIWR